MKTIIFGAGGIGRRLCEEIRTHGNDEVLCFVDNNRHKQNTIIDDVKVLNPDKIFDFDYDKIIISTTYTESILAQLLDMGINRGKIEVKENLCILTRIQWLRDFSGLYYARGNERERERERENIYVAEAGVFQGDFAKHIHEFFPDKRLYLFDTFEGFPKEDVGLEILPSAAKEGHYDNTSVDAVLKKLGNSDKCVIKKGYFPQTAEGIDDLFCFVNLDLDLYQPTFEGLKFFWEKMVDGGVILVHDFFGIDYPNVKTAVFDFEKQLGERLRMLPIGDALSIAILK
jgi:hypothetical protein